MQRFTRRRLPTSPDVFVYSCSLRKRSGSTQSFSFNCKLWICKFRLWISILMEQISSCFWCLEFSSGGFAHLELEWHMITSWLWISILQKQIWCLEFSSDGFAHLELEWHMVTSCQFKFAQRYLLFNLNSFKILSKFFQNSFNFEGADFFVHLVRVFLWWICTPWTGVTHQLPNFEFWILNFEEADVFLPLVRVFLWWSPAGCGFQFWRSRCLLTFRGSFPLIKKQISSYI